MKAHNLKYTVAFFLLLSPFGMFAQQQMATDSISIFELMDAVEKGHVLPCLYNDNGSF